MKTSVFKKIVQAANIYIYILLSWRSIITFGFSAIGAIFYYLMSWKELELLWAKAILKMLTLGDHSAWRIHNDIFLGKAAIAIRIGSVCTYIPSLSEMCISIPFYKLIHGRDYPFSAGSVATLLKASG